MITRIYTLLALGLFALASVAASASEVQEDTARREFFEKTIRPLLVDNCYTCHSAETNAKGGLRVDDGNGLRNGGNSGPAVVPGNVEESLLILAVSYTDDNLKMPPKQQLSDEQISDLKQWIAEGATWPTAEVAPLASPPNEKYEHLRQDHWAWQPLKSPAPPTVVDNAWVREPIDAFIRAQHEAKGVKPVGEASKRALLRRVTFDLTGLPPTPEELAAFESDSEPDALARVVDRLLASKAFGEHWGRHWLDVARYGESTGSSRNVPYPHAWRYRDWVIDAFNDDKPFDQFVREQVAGDLLPAADQSQGERQQIATGLLALGVKDVNQRFKPRFVMDNVDEQIDTVTRSVLGLTVSCARCHDHKFDPIPQQDYYALAGIFTSTDLCAGVRNTMGGGGLDYYDPQLLVRIGPDVPEDPASSEKLEEAQKRLEEARAEFEALRGNPAGNERGKSGKPKRQIARQKMNRVQAEVLALSDPLARGGQAAHGVRDAKAIADTELRIRGEAERLGQLVPRGFLSVLVFDGQPSVNREQSGRLELAQWLTSSSNALTQRVIVNRVWKHLFSEGLVRTVDNFGVTGDVPSHPELLDYLAAEFVRDGWSIKRLIRRIVLTRTYGLGSDTTPELLAADPQNRLLWRHAPRRLTGEEIRDATLAVTAAIITSRPEGSPASSLKVVELRNNGPDARSLLDNASRSAHRSIYLPLLRGLVPTSLAVFDFAEQGMVTGARDTTTVAPQAMYFLNDPLVQRRSIRLAERLLSAANLSDRARVSMAYELTVSRAATDAEIERALGYVSGYETNIAGLVDWSARVADSNNDAKQETAVDDVAILQNPDEADQSDTPVEEKVIQASSAKAAAWASFCQALLGSAEFRYLQ